jgi:TonB family protein
MNPNRPYYISIIFHLMVFAAVTITPQRELTLSSQAFVPVSFESIQPPDHAPEPEPIKEDEPTEKEKPKKENIDDRSISSMQEELKTPTPKPTNTPGRTPTVKPTNTPTKKPTTKPTNTPVPTRKPTEKPTSTPKPKPTATEKPKPTNTPTSVPEPTAKPIADVPTPVPYSFQPPARSEVPLSQIPSTSASGPAGYSFSIEGVSGYDYSAYGRRLNSILYNSWRPPSVRPPEARKFTTVVSFVIHENGLITDFVVQVPSGWPIMDKTVQEAIQRVSPLKDLPSMFLGGTIKVTVPFVFNPT